MQLTFSRRKFSISVASFSDGPMWRLANPSDGDRNDDDDEAAAELRRFSSPREDGPPLGLSVPLTPPRAAHTKPLRKDNLLTDGLE